MIWSLPLLVWLSFRLLDFSLLEGHATSDVTVFFSGLAPTWGVCSCQPNRAEQSLHFGARPKTPCHASAYSKGGKNSSSSVGIIRSFGNRPAFSSSVFKIEEIFLFSVVPSKFRRSGKADSCFEKSAKP